MNSNGLISLEELEENLSEETALVSIMAVNNEIGVLQPVQEIGRLCRLDERIGLGRKKNEIGRCAHLHTR